jgi:hypothetical protein
VIGVHCPEIKEGSMFCRRLICALATLLVTITGAAAFEDAAYPDWKGEWSRIGSLAWDPTKPRGTGQQAPLTPEYQAVLDASLADQAHGGQGNYPGSRCLPYGMPGAMFPYRPMEIVITPEVTHILLEHMTQHRRIYTDGRGWPEKLSPAFNGYSIGRWIDEDQASPEQPAAAGPLRCLRAGVQHRTPARGARHEVPG